jgi:hypothetical protein
MLVVDGKVSTGQPIVLTEFGGIAFGGSNQGTWGYSRADTGSELLQRYTALMKTIRALPALAGFCYTQFTDTYQEVNGLLYADRTPKAPLKEIALATTGARPDYDLHTESAWRERVMQRQRRYPGRSETSTANS